MHSKATDSQLHLAHGAEKQQLSTTSSQLISVIL